MPYEGGDTGGGRRVYVGNIDYAVAEAQLKEEFNQFGPITNIAYKQGFAFIDFDDTRDAQGGRVVDGEGDGRKDAEEEQKRVVERHHVEFIRRRNGQHAHADEEEELGQPLAPEVAVEAAALLPERRAEEAEQRGDRRDAHGQEHGLVKRDQIPVKVQEHGGADDEEDEVNA